MPEKNTLWPTPEEPWRCISRIGPSKGKSGLGRAPATRPCAYADLHTTEVRGVASRGLYEREKCDSYSAHALSGSKAVKPPALPVVTDYFTIP
jgi:hypothetical protein